MNSDPMTWPRSVRRTVDAVAGVVAFLCRLSGERAANLGQLAKLQFENTQKDATLNQQTRELEMLRRRLNRVPYGERPHYPPEDRFTILRMAWFNGWSTKDVAARFVVEVGTVQRWLRIWQGRRKSHGFFGKPAWNKLSDAVRDLIRDCRMQFSETDIGTRTITAQILKAGIALSRSSVQRILKEPPPKKPNRSDSSKKRGETTGEPVKPYHILTPDKPNQTWHVDFTTIRILWIHFHIAAVLDGFSRKLLTVSVFSRAPRTNDILDVLKGAVRNFGAPRFLVTDHGPQFKKCFKAACKLMRISHVQGRPYDPKFNGKIERLFRTFKLWQRAAVLFLSVRPIQSALNNFVNWYNTQRTHQSLQGLTPEEAWIGQSRPDPIRCLARDADQPGFILKRENFGDDSKLRVFSIQVLRSVKKVPA